MNPPVPVIRRCSPRSGPPQNPVPTLTSSDIPTIDPRPATSTSPRSSNSLTMDIPGPCSTSKYIARLPTPFLKPYHAPAVAGFPAQRPQHPRD